MSEKDLAERVPVPAARDEVGRLAETMNGMIARLEQAQNVQRRFVADASHELRSPLATIGAGLELLQDSDPSTVGALRGETRRLGRLVDDLLLLARADERGLQPRHDEVDLDEIVEAERGRPYEDGMCTEVRAEHVRVVGDRSQLVRVLRNLVDNAHRHARSRVLVTLGRDGDRAVLDVADDGPGVPAADRIRIFERFVRLDDARARADGGSGLGLAIVAEVVAAHDGQVWVEDAPSGGALFRVRLPAAELPVDEDFEPTDLPGDDLAEPQSPSPTPNGTAPAAGAANGHPAPAFGTNGTPSPTPALNGTASRAAMPNGTASPAPAPNGTASPAPVPNGTASPAPVPNGTARPPPRPTAPQRPRPPPTAPHRPHPPGTVPRHPAPIPPRRTGPSPPRPGPTAPLRTGPHRAAPPPRHRFDPGAPAAGRSCAARRSCRPRRTTRTPTGCRPNRHRPPQRRPTATQAPPPPGADLQPPRTGEDHRFGAQSGHIRPDLHQTDDQGGVAGQPGSAIRYPTPRRVSMLRTPNGTSILRRR